MAQGGHNADPDCASRLLYQKAIEHGRQHQPTTAEIAIKLAAKVRSDSDKRWEAGQAAAVAELYVELMDKSAEPRAPSASNGAQRAIPPSIVRLEPVM